MANLRTTALVLLGLALLLCGCARRPAAKAPEASAPPVHRTPAYDIMDGDLVTHTLDPVTRDEFLFRSREADYILIGEGHTVACDHAVQTSLIRELARAGRAPIVGLEMVDDEFQPVLDRFNAGQIPVEELREALEWDTHWRHDFAGYEPIFTLSRGPNMPPLYALNLPTRVVHEASRAGLDSLPEEDKPFLPSQIVPPSDEQVATLEKVFERHEAMRMHANATATGNATTSAMGHTPPKQDRKADLARFLDIQSLWDSKMAERAATLHKSFGVPVIILAGGGHVENGWGIAHRLATFDPEAKVFIVMPWRGGHPPSEKEADLFFYCPETHTSRLGFTLEMRKGQIGAKTVVRAVVLNVAEDSRAAKAGFQPGDVLLKAEDKEIDSLWSLHQAGLAAKQGDGILHLSIRREGQPMELTLPLTDR